jgi:hypothetical protein
MFKRPRIAITAFFLILLAAALMSYFSPFQRCFRAYVRSNPGATAADSASQQCMGVAVLR